MHISASNQKRSSNIFSLIKKRKFLDHKFWAVRTWSINLELKKKTLFFYLYTCTGTCCSYILLHLEIISYTCHISTFKICGFMCIQWSKIWVKNKLNPMAMQCLPPPPPLYIYCYSKIHDEIWSIISMHLLSSRHPKKYFFFLVAHYLYMKVFQQLSSLIFMILRFDTKWLDQGVLKALMLIKFLWKLINYRCIPYFLPQFYPILRSKIYNWSARLSRKMLF